MTLQFKEPHVIRATYRIVTPMFIGDANQAATGISPASVKGALRFWWRALNWARVYKSAAHSESDALKRLHEEESELFGSSAENGKAASFTLRVVPEKLKSTLKDAAHPQFSKYTAARYMSYGLMEAFSSKNKGTSAGTLWRDCINEEQEFTINITSYDSVGDALQTPLIVMGLLGGLGSRVSRGLGSISLQSLTMNASSVWTKPDTIEAYSEQLRKILNALGCASEPPFSAISNSTSIDILTTSDTPYKCLESLGAGMMHYRSWGNNNKVLGVESERNFKADHDWKYKKTPKGFHPKRVIFGLPHNYGKGSHLAITPELKRDKKEFSHERRKSPLLFHVHQVGDLFIGISLFLPSKFLPDGEKINAGGENVPAVIDWSVLTDLIYGNQKSGEKRFANRVSILKGESL